MEKEIFKVIATQVPPEIQQSPLMEDWDEMQENARDWFVYGNKSLASFLTPLAEAVLNIVDKSGDILKAADNGENCAAGNIAGNTAAFTVTEAQAGAVIAALREYDGRRRDDIVCRLLSILTGSEWRVETICGSRQDDWQQMYYNAAAISGSEVSLVEIEYFNLGTQWNISTASFPEEVDFTCYTHGWQEEDTRRELLKITGADEVEMRIFDGYDKIPRYKTV